MKPFVHLHNHTAYSLLDGVGRISDEVERAVALGMPALAITDHGVMYGALEFYKACKKHGIKPIIGCEVYVAPRTRFDKENKKDASPYHLILLVKNEIGYRNLCEIVSAGSLDGFYYHPRVDREIIEKHHEGLIAMSACLGGEVPRNIMAGDYQGALAVCRWYQSLFGEDYYLELQNHGIPEQFTVNEVLHQLSAETGIKLVVTNDNHYVTAEGADVQDIMLCIQTGKTIDDPNRMRFDQREFYLKSYDEMLRMFPDDVEALDETVRIAEKCDFEFTTGINFMPNFQTPNNESHKDYLRHLCEKGIAERYAVVTEEIQERLNFELATIDKMGYNTYFLIVWDFINYANQIGVYVGPGRGSAAGSIVSYVLRITDIDPIKYQLLFERFLNPERVSMPDIDIDFCYERRGEVLEYVTEKYGADHVSQIITFGTLKAKGAIRDVGRVLNIPLPVVNKVAKLVPDELGMTIEKAIHASEELRALMEQDAEIRHLVEVAQTIEGLPRNAGTHAAAVVISPKPVVYYSPLQRTKDGFIATQYAKEDVEEIGLLKMDFLSLRTLTVLNKTILSVKERYGIDVDFQQIADDDQATYDMLSKGDSIGVFQLEGTGLREILKELKPTNLEDIIALVALYRPGPLGSGMATDFIARKHGEQEIAYIDPKLEPILNTTYGVILYQEQVMQIASRMAGFTLGDADMLRRAMGKKKPEIIANYKRQFIDGAVENGTEANIAENIFELMAYFAGYGFNKSHSAAYGVLSYQTAYLKCHYPKEYMTEILNSFIDDLEKVTFYVNECRQLGISVLPPDINASGVNFTATDEGIRFGLGAIKGLGKQPVGLICEARKEAPFTSFEDFCTRTELGSTLNKRAIENLISCGAFDSLGQGTRALLCVAEECVKQGKEIQKQKNSMQMSLFDFMGESHQEMAVQITMPEVEEISMDERLRLEKELLGIYVSGHPLDSHIDEVKKQRSCAILDISEKLDNVQVQLAGILTNIKFQTTKKGDLMAIAVLEDLESTIDVLVFPKTLPQVRDQLEENRICLVRGRVSIQDENKKIFLEEIAPLSQEAVAEEAVQEEKTVFIKIDDALDYSDTDVVNYLAEQPHGKVAVCLCYMATRKMVQLKERYWLANDDMLFKDLEIYFGFGNVNIKIKEGK